MTMTKQEALNYIKGSGTIDREPFTFTFTQTTLQRPSRVQFKEAVEVLGGWLVSERSYFYRPNPKYYPNKGKNVLETVACIPEAAGPYMQPKSHKNMRFS